MTHLSFAKRRERLEQLGLDEHWWTTPNTFDDGQALYDAVCERRLEGIVAKWRRSSYGRGGALDQGEEPSALAAGVRVSGIWMILVSRGRARRPWPFSGCLQEGVVAVVVMRGCV